MATATIRCPVCSFENCDFMDLCDLCDARLPESCIASRRREEQQGSGEGRAELATTGSQMRILLGEAAQLSTLVRELGVAMADAAPVVATADGASEQRPAAEVAGSEVAGWRHKDDSKRPREAAKPAKRALKPKGPFDGTAPPVHTPATGGGTARRRDAPPPSVELGLFNIPSPVTAAVTSAVTTQPDLPPPPARAPSTSCAPRERPGATPGSCMLLGQPRREERDKGGALRLTYHPGRQLLSHEFLAHGDHKQVREVTLVSHVTAEEWQVLAHAEDLPGWHTAVGALLTSANDTKRCFSAPASTVQSHDHADAYL